MRPCFILFTVLMLTLLIPITSFAQKPELVVQVGHSDNVYSAVFSPDGKLFASAGSDGPIKIWDAATRQLLRTLKGHAKGVNSNLAFSPDRRMLASSGNDKIDGEYTVKFWDVITGRELKAFPGYSVISDSIAFSPDGKSLAVGSSDGNIRIWDVQASSQSV